MEKIVKIKKKFDTLKEKFGSTGVAFLTLASLATLASFIAIIIYAVFASAGGSARVTNHFIALWLCLLIVFYSLQIIYINLRSPHSSRKILYFETGYFILAIIGASLLFICYCFTAKIDAIVWSIVLIAVLLVNIFTLTLRKGVTISENIKLSENVNLKYSEDETSITEPKDKKEARKFGETCLKILDIVLKILFLVFLALLVNASIVIGPFTIRYQPQMFI